ncbi:MAG TPA: universal stress protein [Gammaproteobacteria bacterium]|nr:universal stress protein [Gammaproteobacteria bacterium]
MTKRPQILLVLEGSLERTPAVLRAISLARRMDAVLQLRSFEYLRSLEHAARRGFDLEAYLRGRRQRLEEFAGRIREEQVQVECGVIWGQPLAEQIILQTLALKPNLVIKDTRAETTLNRAFYSTADWRLLSVCPAPLMLVHPRSASVPKHILAAVDPLDEHDKPRGLNDDILVTALGLATQCGAELDVVNVHEFIPPAGEWEYLGWMPDLTLYGELSKIHAEGLYKLGRQYSVPPGKMHILHGDPARCIIDFAADRHVDLVVMGSVYRTGLDRLLIGSTAEGVFDRLACDVLVLKPEGFAAAFAAGFEAAKPKAA